MKFLISESQNKKNPKQQMCTRWFTEVGKNQSNVGVVGLAD